MLGSGSTGNCTLIATARARLLVDAGLSLKEVRARLAAAGEPESVDAILISHEHTDHVAGLSVLAKRLKVPVFITRITAPAISWNGVDPKLETYQAGTRLVVGDIEIDTFTIPHDAIDPVGFCFRAQGVKIGIATDLGYIPESVKYHLRGTDLLVIESNHDLEMLKVGPYPWAVKQRVMGRKGHLSNDMVCDFLRRDLDTTTSTVVLAHLSEHNNHPEIVRLGAEQALERRALFTRLVIAGHRAPTEVFEY